MTDDVPAHDSAAPEAMTGHERTFRQAFDLWITPEVTRRVEAGLLTPPLDLQKAQVIFRRGEQHPIVRLNDEVRISLIVKAKVALNEGDPVAENDVEEIQGFELDHAERDDGHVTLLRWRDGWRMLFDFQQNKGRASQLVSTAEEFLGTAQHALSSGYASAYVDNLFSACELLAKARLMTSAAEDKIDSHKAIHSKINWWSKLGNVDAEFVDLFNRLSAARSNARYVGQTDSTLTDKDRLAIAANEAALLRARLKRFSDDP